MFANLKLEMIKRGLSARKVAQKLEITEKTFSNKINGKTEFTLSEINALMRLFDKDIGYLFKFDFDGDEQAATKDAM